MKFTARENYHNHLLNQTTAKIIELNNPKNFIGDLIHDIKRFIRKIISGIIRF